MTDGFLNIDSTGIAGHGNLAWGQHSDSADGMTVSHLRTAVGWLPIVLILTAAGWLLLSHAFEQTDGQPIRLRAAQAKSVTAGATVGVSQQPSFDPRTFDPRTSEAIVPGQPAPVDGLKISSQSWRRGGLGSNAFVTMTLHNDNGYAVKDIDIACAFSRPDGSHLTDRSRTIRDVINMKSRKTFVRLHVGFINVNAAKAKCSLLAANHI
jgi:hypothetical protein